MQYFKPVAATAATTVFLIQDVLDLSDPISYEETQSISENPIKSEISDLSSEEERSIIEEPAIKLRLKLKVISYDIVESFY